MFNFRYSLLGLFVCLLLFAISGKGYAGAVFPPYSAQFRTVSDESASVFATVYPQLKSDDFLLKNIGLPTSSSHSTEIDRLFLELGNCEDDEQARKISGRLQKLFAISGSETVDLLMSRAGKAIKAENYEIALDLLDAVLRLAPNYVEGWNRRATVHYLREDFGKSVADIERALLLEPRHFPALSGLGMILRRMGKAEKALEVFLYVLKINPMQESAQEAVEALKKEVREETI
ncbi:tetratricopeptide repeat protein [Flexibacterium corallicola]|uniref:tetratricopeptide repeat protein n=1 Tax=Flexibacterium corallicola TaxID=3037259 RepID=UPI00286FA439|nr:tetratricopeptide repeat protein [Pseudovibrio sp. M1P-2-3]